MNLTVKQVMWLWTQGGRTTEDVFWSKGIMIVFMSSKGKEKEIRIPEDKDIQLYINSHGRIRNSGN